MYMAMSIQIPIATTIKEFQKNVKDLFHDQTGVTKHFNDLLASHANFFNETDDISKFFLNLKNAQDEFFDPQHMPNVSASTLAGHMTSLHKIVTNFSIAPILKLNINDEYEELLDVIDKRKKNYNNIAKKASRDKDKTPEPPITITTQAPPPPPSLEDPLEDPSDEESEEEIVEPHSHDKAVSMLRKYKMHEIDPFKRLYLELILELLV